MANILGRSFSVALKLGARAELFLLAQTARRDGIDFKVTLIESDFDQPERGVFDPQYMQALFDRGVAKGLHADFQQKGFMTCSLEPNASHCSESALTIDHRPN